jgi:hypothetical protein
MSDPPSTPPRIPQRRLKPMPWRGIALWVVVSAAGTVLISASGIASYLVPGLQPFTMVALALLQWLILRLWIPKVGWWAPATVFGWLAGPPVGLTIGEIIADVATLILRPFAGIERLPSLAETLVGYACIGLVIGLCLWVVLRRSLPRARWWIAVLTLAWGLSEPAAAGGAELVNGLKETTGPELWYAGYWGTNALLHATVTGAALAWITREVGVPDLRRALE